MRSGTSRTLGFVVLLAVAATGGVFFLQSQTHAQKRFQPQQPAQHSLQLQDQPAQLAARDAHAAAQVAALPPALVDRQQAHVACDRVTADRCAPYFILTGAGHCGASLLASYLARYPGIRFPPSSAASDPVAQQSQHEQHFHDLNWPWRQKPWDTQAHRQQYAALLADSDWHETFAVDKSMAYFSSPYAVQHIPRLMPHTRVVVALCDPTRRVWNDLQTWYRRVHTDRTRGDEKYANLHHCRLFSPNMAGEALKQIEQLRANGKDLNKLCPPNHSFRACSLCAYLRASSYLEQLRLWQAAIMATANAQSGEIAQVSRSSSSTPLPKQLIVVDIERLRHRPRQTVFEVLSALGLNTARYPEWQHLASPDEVRHVEKDQEGDQSLPDNRFPPRVRRLLNGVFIDMMEPLRKLTGQTFEYWQISSADETNVL